MCSPSSDAPRAKKVHTKAQNVTIFSNGLHFTGDEDGHVLPIQSQHTDDMAIRRRWGLFFLNGKYPPMVFIVHRRKYPISAAVSATLTFATPPAAYANPLGLPKRYIMCRYALCGQARTRLRRPAGRITHIMQNFGSSIPRQSRYARFAGCGAVTTRFGCAALRQKKRRGLASVSAACFLSSCSGGGKVAGVGKSPQRQKHPHQCILGRAVQPPPN